jgi:putative hemolysin
MINEIVTLIILVLLSALFSASETAFISVSRFKVRLFAKKKLTGAFYLEKLKENPHRMLETLLFCNTLINITASIMFADIALRIFKNNPLAYATAIMTFVILLFGEIIPKNFATVHYSTLALFMAPIIYGISILLYPIVMIFDFISVKIFRLKPKKPKITEEEISNIIDIAKEEGGIDNEEKEMIHRIFKFDDISVNEIKIPRTDMLVMNMKMNLGQALELIKKNPHSRIPVYKNNRDKIIGIFYFKDSIKYINSKKFDISIKRLMREPLFIPKTKKIDDTLRLLQRKKQQMAIIVDEHGGVSGLITMEDILEEIVGDISDETDEVNPLFQKVDSKTYRVQGKADIEEVNEKLKVNFKTEAEFDTLSGYILNKLGRIPLEGEEIELDKGKIIVKKIKGNRIVEVIIKKG